MDNIEKNKNIISSNITLFRNIKNTKFPICLELEEGQDVAENIIATIEKEMEELKCTRLWKDKYSFEDLKEKRIIRNKTLKNKGISAMLISNSEKVSIIINEEEHLRLQYIESGYNIEEMYENVKEVDRKLEKKLNYSFDEVMGYLTSNLLHIGTGLKIGVIIHLPMLTLNDKINKLFSYKDKTTFSLEGKYGEKGKAYGNIYSIKNNTTTNVTEEEIIYDFKELIEYVLNEEMKERDRAIGRYKNEIEDKIYRAYGVLKEARILDSIETLNLLSYVRLGVELGILNLPLEVIDRAVFISRNAQIKELLNEKYDIESINLKRAEVIRNILII